MLCLAPGYLRVDWCGIHCLKLKVREGKNTETWIQSIIRRIHLMHRAPPTTGQFASATQRETARTLSFDLGQELKRMHKYTQDLIRLGSIEKSSMLVSFFSSQMPYRLSVQRRRVCFS